MRIGGYQKLTLIDYPGNIATTVFTVGCSFLCPFCHNPELVIRSKFISFDGDMEKNFFNHLKNRVGKIEGVCITGGEPTIQPDIIDFIKKIKAMGFKIKLDSNGTRPDVLKKIISEKLVDFIAMDIKSSLENYEKAAGCKVDTERIKLSVEMIMKSNIDYEFRTTVVPGLHKKSDFMAIAEWLNGAKSYYLQEYRDGIILNDALKKITLNKKIDLEKIKNIIKKNFGNIGIRKNN